MRNVLIHNRRRQQVVPRSTVLGSCSSFSSPLTEPAIQRDLSLYSSVLSSVTQALPFNAHAHKTIKPEAVQFIFHELNLIFRFFNSAGINSIFIRGRRFCSARMFFPRFSAKLHRSCRRACISSRSFLWKGVNVKKIK